MKYLLASVFLLVACSISTSSNVHVEITGDKTAEEKLKIAETIALNLWERGLTEEIAQSVPEIKNINLKERMGLKWKATTFNSFTDDSNDRTVVYIECLTNLDQQNLVNRVLELCKKAIEKEVSKNE